MKKSNLISLSLPIRTALFVAIFIFLGRFSVHAADHPLVVAYIDGDMLYIWQEGTPAPHTIATGKLSHPLLSPDATQVIFQRDNDLWIADLTNASSAPKALVTSDTLTVAPDKSRFILDAVWLDSKTIIFNTYHYHPNTLVQQQYADDLWQVDISSGKVTRLLSDGDGGEFSISPDGKHIALTRPGDYAKNAPGAIMVVDINGQNAVKLLEFPVVNTGASYQFYPQVRWTTDSSSLLVAIPDPNLIYATDKVPSTALWKLDISGSKTQVGSVKADFFGLPEFSSDGKFILYAQRIGDLKDNQIALFHANSDGTAEQEIVRDSIGRVEPARWLLAGDGYTLVHGSPGAMWLGGPSYLHRFPNEFTLVFNLKWVDGITYIYSTSPGGAGEIQYGGYGIDRLVTAAKCAACSEFDARYKP